jgi:hypothetical protein
VYLLRYSTCHRKRARHWKCLLHSTPEESNYCAELQCLQSRTWRWRRVGSPSGGRVHAYYSMYDRGMCKPSRVMALLEGNIARSFRRRHRGLRQTLLRSIQRAERMSTDGVFQPYSSPFVHPDFSRFQRVLRKITKGLYYHIRENPLPSDYQVLVNQVIKSSTSLKRGSPGVLRIIAFTSFWLLASQIPW